MKSKLYSICFAYGVFVSVCSLLIPSVYADPSARYFEWIEGRGLNEAQKGWLADPDSDGLNNYEEYALGGDPTQDDAVVIKPSILTGESSSQVIYRRRTDDLELVYEFWQNDDLTSALGWTSLVDSTVIGIADSAVPNVQIVTNQFDAARSATFYQVKVNDVALYTTYLEENTSPMITALKGMRPSNPNVEDFYNTIRFDHISWNDLEMNEDDTVQDILAECEERWTNADPDDDYTANTTNYNRHGLRIIPHLNIVPWVEKANGSWGAGDYELPNGLTVDDYINTTELFERRLRRFIAKLGQAWDNDPRIPWINVGFFGTGGAHEKPQHISLKQQEILSSAFNSAFKNKKLMMNYVTDFPKEEYGVYNRSWAHPNESAQEEDINQFNQETGRWKVAPITGQLSYYSTNDMRYVIGVDADETLSTPLFLDRLLDVIRKNHCTGLGQISDYMNEASYAGAAAVQKALGYRFVITEASWSEFVSPGGNFNFSFTVKNEGSAPFYYDWPVYLYLLHPDTKNVEASAELVNTDIRNWLSGDSWDSDADEYLIAASNYVETATINIPSDLPPNQYIVALGVEDPLTNKRAVRFAVNNYFDGLLYPLGYIGVGQEVSGGYNVNSFDSLGTYTQQKQDLTYDVPVNTFNETINAPTAHAGNDRTEPDSTVELDGSLSDDSDGEVVHYLWTENYAPIATGMVAEVTLAAGTHTITLIVSDNHGATATDEVVITVDGTVPPPVNLIRNGDFSDGVNGWSRWASSMEGASADFSAVDEEGYLSIDSGGSAGWAVSFSQSGVNLEQSKTYTLSFDLRSPDGVKDIVVSVRNAQDPWEQYHNESMIVHASMSSTMQGYEFTFVATVSDANAQLLLRCGGDNHDVYIDNVELYEQQ